MVVAYKKAMDIELEKKAPKRPSEFVGVIGKRQEFVLTLKTTRTFEGTFGPSTMHQWEDAEGNKLTWWESGNSGKFEDGKTYLVKATPKKHELYKNIKFTTISRTAIVKEM